MFVLTVSAVIYFLNSTPRISEQFEQRFQTESQCYDAGHSFKMIAASSDKKDSLELTYTFTCHEIPATH